MEMSDNLTHATAAVAVVNPWVLNTTSELQLVFVALGIVWLALQITLKILSIRKHK